VPDPLPFTGERFTPECVREIWYEHVHRYVFARPLARGRRVLDVACGEGYGSALLAQAGAQAVLGLDISEAAIEHARGRYRRENLRFAVADCARLPLPDDSIDLIVSFETLEHVEQQAAMLDECLRVLTPAGQLLISSPDKRVYSDATGFVNEFHVRELYREEFEDLLTSRFVRVRLFGQKLLFQSVVWPLEGTPGCGRMEATHDGKLVQAGVSPYDPVYFIAACSNDKTGTPSVGHGGLSLFGDLEESVYKHYNAEVRHHIESAEAFAAMQARIVEMEAAVEEKDPLRLPAMAAWFRRWFGKN